MTTDTLLASWVKELADEELVSAAEGVLSGGKSAVEVNIVNRWLSNAPGLLFPAGSYERQVVKEAASRWVKCKTS